MTDTPTNAFRARLPDAARAHSSYGWAARLGLIVPTANTVNEAEWQAVLSAVEGISLHVARMPLHLSCTDFPTLRVVPALEARIGKPVISSNGATLWRLLQLAGQRAAFAGRGRLLQGERCGG